VTLRTTFTDRAAVEAWDARFRWREGSVLHDRTIGETWDRIVRAVAPVEGEDAAIWSQRWKTGFSRWQWLPDDRLLRESGTGVSPTYSGPIRAVLNVNAFVRPWALGDVRRSLLDTHALADAAAVVLRFLDDALIATPTVRAPGLRLGLLGMADALSALRIAYGSPEACQMARDAGAAIASGALRGAVALARERGGRTPSRSRLDVLLHLGMSRSLVDDALRWGVRHEWRTAIVPAPRLAVFANNASDALDPRRFSRPLGGSSGYEPVLLALPSLAAQLALRAAIQPWIDEPIESPLVDSMEPDSTSSRDDERARTAQSAGYPR